MAGGLIDTINDSRLMNGRVDPLDHYRFTSAGMRNAKLVGESTRKHSINIYPVFFPAAVLYNSIRLSSTACGCGW